jgi:hypothetical protein
VISSVSSSLISIHKNSRQQRSRHEMEWNEMKFVEIINFYSAWLQSSLRPIHLCGSLKLIISSIHIEIDRCERMRNRNRNWHGKKSKKVSSTPNSSPLTWELPFIQSIVAKVLVLSTNFFFFLYSPSFLMSCLIYWWLWWKWKRMKI